MYKKILIVVIVSTISCYASGSKNINTKPLIWNVDNIDKVKIDSRYAQLYKHIVVMADSYCELTPLAITDTKKPFVGDNHFYCSTGPYWWPDSTTSEVKYIRRDGLINPDYYNSDSQKIKELERRCRYLCVAFYLTEKETYYNAFIRQLKAWFLDEETAMYPNFEYAQVIPGENMNKGRSTGLIEAYAFNSIIEGIRLVNIRRSLDDRTLQGVKQWFSLFAKWMSKSDFGKKQSKAPTNLSVAYDVTLLNIYLFCSKTGNARVIANKFYRNRILTQITEEGLQPAELSRTKAYLYSVFNLTHIVDFFSIMKHWNNRIYNSIPKERTDAAFAYLLQFVDDKDSFPYEELYKTDWQSCVNSVMAQWRRYNHVIKDEDYDIVAEKTLSSTFSGLFN